MKKQISQERLEIETLLEFQDVARGTYNLRRARVLFFSLLYEPLLRRHSDEKVQILDSHPNIAVRSSNESCDLCVCVSLPLPPAIDPLVCVAEV